MKKVTRKQRQRDVTLSVLLRKKGRNKYKKKDTKDIYSSSWSSVNDWIDAKKHEGLNVSIDRKRRVILTLPPRMNFSDMYEPTALHISAIRKLTEHGSYSKKNYWLTSVNFDNLEEISTSAALVLTAELSKWDDIIRQRLTPSIDGWDCDILKQFSELGFFELFNNNPLDATEHKESPCTHSDIRLVKYIKGRCGDKAKTRILKEEIRNIVGESISKWTFLDSGLSEAITNVSHHAYPDSYQFYDEDKNWYLTGSYNSDTKELKIVFYDQGIGIPRSLPESEVWEKVLAFFSKYSIIEKKRHEVLLKAAVELDRTSTFESDRGKGLQDLLEFIKQRKHGYLSILSLKGLYKYSLENERESVKTVAFDNEINGTLIIWSANLTV